MPSLSYQTDGPFIVGRPTVINLIGIPPNAFLIDWTETIGNGDITIVLDPTDDYRATITPLSSRPVQLMVQACPNPDYIQLTAKDNPLMNCDCD